MNCLGWLFLISGIISAFLWPILGLPSIAIGFLLLSLGRKGKHGRYNYLAKKYKYKAEKHPEKAEDYLRKARKYELKKAKYE